MKFPLQKRPFAPLQLSREQCAHYERTAMDVVLETMDEFDDFVHRENRTVDPKLWKSVRTRENVTVYKKRELESMVLPQGASTGDSSSNSSTRSTESVSAITQWTLPKLLGVGSIVGDFDDVMYGVISPDLDSIKVKTTYVDDELVDSDILQVIQRGTIEDPYRFIGIKWFVKATPSGNIVKPRDLVFVEATGVYVNDHGDKYGYHVMHSVDLRQCPRLDHMGLRRGKISSCFLFRPLPNRSVEVYMKSFFDVAGNLPDVVAIMSGVNGLIGFWKSVYSAERKKLAWLLQQSRSQGSRPAMANTDAKGRPCCALCDQKFSALRSSVACELCRVVVCSRCEATRKLTYVVDGVVTKETTPFCKNCITRANHMNAAEIARIEHVEGAAERRHRAATSAPASQASVRARSASVSIPGRGGRRKESVYDEAERHDIRTTLAPTAMTKDLDRYDLASETIPSMALVPSLPRPAVAAPSQATTAQQELWLRMRELRIQAEQAYRLTAQNNHAMAKAVDGKALY